jgi:hypothetical protein
MGVNDRFGHAGIVRIEIKLSGLLYAEAALFVRPSRMI